MQPTPASEASVYFDAPITHFHSQPTAEQQQRQDPVTVINLESEPEMSTQRTYNLTDPGPQVKPEQQPQQDAIHQNQNQPSQNFYNRKENESLGWLPATDLPADHVDQEDADRREDDRQTKYAPAVLKKSPRHPGSTSSNSIRSASAPGSIRRPASRAASVRSTGRQSLFTNKEDGQPVEGSTFSYGAGTTGPSTSPQPHESLIARSNSAAAQLTPKQRSKISKADCTPCTIL